MSRAVPYVLIVLLVAAWGVSRYWFDTGEREHPHRASVHGGSLISLAGDRYHVETVQLADGTLRLYTYGADETSPLEIPAQTITAFARGEGESGAIEITLTPEIQPGDSPGSTTCLVGRVPSSMNDRTLLFTIPSLEIEGQRLRVAWMSHPAVEMPSGVSGDEERELYLTPGGRYTAADIAANGSTTASERYAGFRAKHDANPQRGELICPITATKANPACTWVIDSQTYQFCCPPCIDEFVRQAKESNAPLKPPEEFVKR
jgi:hypothetical protein